MRSPSGAEQLDELRAPAVQHLGGSVEDLAAIHGRSRGPSGNRPPSRAHRVAQVLARAARDVDIPVKSISPSRLGAYELAVDEKLVCLPNFDPAVSALGSRHLVVR